MIHFIYKDPGVPGSALMLERLIISWIFLIPLLSYSMTHSFCIDENDETNEHMKNIVYQTKMRARLCLFFYSFGFIMIGVMALISCNMTVYISSHCLSLGSSLLCMVILFAVATYFKLSARKNVDYSKLRKISLAMLIIVLRVIIYLVMGH